MITHRTYRAAVDEQTSPELCVFCCSCRKSVVLVNIRVDRTAIVHTTNIIHDEMSVRPFDTGWQIVPFSEPHKSAVFCSECDIAWTVDWAKVFQVAKREKRSTMNAVAERMR